MRKFYQNNAAFVVKYICGKNENAPEITSEAYCIFLEQ